MVLNQAFYRYDGGPSRTSQIGKQLGFRKGFCKVNPENPSACTLGFSWVLNFLTE